jgi:GT2 family glycosyltransferase
MQKWEQGEKLPRFTVVVSTRNRGDSVVSTVKSILANDYPQLELRVVDQSSNRLTEEAVQPFLTDARFHYIRSATEGCSLARDIGISDAQSEFIAITDDDCEVPVNWLEEMRKAFTVDNRIGVVFGNVLPGQHDAKSGYIPCFERDKAHLIRSPRQNLVPAMGMGACLGLRRSAWAAATGFDQLMGPGAPFQAWEDQDLALRILLADYYIYQTPELNVIHYGFRSWKEARTLARRNWFALGAGFAKHLKCGHWFIVPYLGYIWSRHAVGEFLHTVFIRHKLSGFTPVSAFIIGLLKGLATPVERSQAKYRLKKL